MPDFSFSHPTIRVRGLKALDYSLTKSSKDFENSKAGFDFYLNVSFDGLKPIVSFPGKAREGVHYETSMKQVGGLVVFLFSPLWSSFSFRDWCVGTSKAL